MNYLKPLPHQQLDLFIDTQSSQLLNRILDGLLAYNTDAASLALRQLKVMSPEDPVLPDLQILMEGLELRDVDLRENFIHGQSVIQPLADRWFKHDSMRWMASYWKLLASHSLSSLVSVADLPLNELHPASLFLRAGAYQSARDTIAALPGWWQQRVTLDWMLSSLLQERSLDTAWSLVFELAWLCPETCISRIESSSITRLKDAHNDFEMQLPAESEQDTVWFPAWMLLREPALLPLVKTTRYPPQASWGQAFETTMNMLTDSIKGKNSTPDQYRRQLQSLHPGLLQALLGN
ncbi:MAG: hypothetical protein HKM02_07245 [Pseudomonadales bacterium]|nr:hypothetical protein [Pseudomonadales bacterium]